MVLIIMGVPDFFVWDIRILDRMVRIWHGTMKGLEMDSKGRVLYLKVLRHTKSIYSVWLTIQYESCLEFKRFKIKVQDSLKLDLSNLNNRPLYTRVLGHCEHIYDVRLIICLSFNHNFKYFKLRTEICQNIVLWNLMIKHFISRFQTILNAPMILEWSSNTCTMRFNNSPLIMSKIVISNVDVT